MSLVPRLALVLLASAALPQAQGQFFDLGSSLTPWDASGDGALVVGEDASTGHYFEWTVFGGAVDIGGVVAGNGIGGSPRVSDDGLFVSGTNVIPMSTFHELSIRDRSIPNWYGSGGLGGSSGNEVSSGWGISGDGTSVVGLGWVSAGEAHAAQWLAGGGPFLVDLGSTVPGRSSRANAVDFDGDVVCGWQDSSSGFRQAAVWSGGVQTVIQAPAGPVSEATAVSGDGQWVCGIGASASLNEAWRWSQAGGLEQLGSLGLGGFPPPRGFATAISHDGRVIVGFDRGFGPPTSGEGWVWTEAGGLVSLDAWFASFGIVPPDSFHFALPLGMSADGLTFVGLGRSDTAFSTGWVVQLTRSGPSADRAGPPAGSATRAL